MPPSNGVPVYTKSEGVRRRSRVSFPSWFPTSRQEKRSTPKFRASSSLSLSLSRARAREREQRRRARQKQETRVYQNKTLFTFRAVQGEMPLENIILQRLRPRGEGVRVGVQLRFCVCELFHLLRDATDGGVVRRRRR